MQTSDNDSGSDSQPNTPRLNRLSTKEFLQKVADRDDQNIYSNPNDKEVGLGILKTLANIELYETEDEEIFSKAIETYVNFLKIDHELKNHINDPSNGDQVQEIFKKALNNNNLNFCDKVLDLINNPKTLEKIKNLIPLPATSLTNPIVEKLESKIQKTQGSCLIQ